MNGTQLQSFFSENNNADLFMGLDQKIEKMLKEISAQDFKKKINKLSKQQQQNKNV